MKSKTIKKQGTHEHVHGSYKKPGERSFLIFPADMGFLHPRIICSGAKVIRIWNFRTFSIWVN